MTWPHKSRLKCIVSSYSCTLAENAAYNRLAIKFANTYIVIGIEDPSACPCEYIWHAVAQEYVSGTHFSSVQTQGSAYIPDTDVFMAESLQAFEHFVFQFSKGAYVIRNFQG